MRSIADVGRATLAELRRLLNVVRPTDDTPSAPQPGLARIDELAAVARSAGLDVTVTQEGEPTTLPAGVDVSAYRIVQEALTNTLRHGNATRADVTVRYGPDAVDIDVVDDGRGTAGRRPDRSWPWPRRDAPTGRRARRDGGDRTDGAAAGFGSTPASR